MLRLTDTRTRKLEDIVPARPGELRMYTCGPTVYRYAHVGNMRAYLLSDLIRRVAELHGLRVTVAQNITDVGHLADDSDVDPSGEDKVLAQAKAEGRSAFDIARFYEAAFHADCATLNIRPAEHNPRASECIPQMIALIEQLIESGHAYAAADGSVFFDARSFDSYGEISGNRLDDLRPGHRVDPETGGAKRFHADWALWKSAGANREMVWDSPWGTGFPGWHIECSVMSLEHLGDDIDIHTGGIDLRFPHHEDERAQSNTAAGRDVVRHWVHGEHLLADGRKMAKSTGNVIRLDDVADRGLDPLAVRLFFLTGRYRQQMNLTWDTLVALDRRLIRWRSRVAQWAESPSVALPREQVDAVVAAFDDDLDTPTALVRLDELARDEALMPGAKFEAFAYLDRVLGLDLVRDVGKPKVVEVLPAGGQELLDQRAQARTIKDFAASDRLRDELAALGVAVADTAEGQTWSLSVR
ncbi:MAG: cysteinyl-tRNA synthetase [Frankiales bacterium]|jgi:cysteinyl-tRNA synthetase|nr:cysteinyl-tRNA synthetase [Frankiales bacterium]